MKKTIQLLIAIVSVAFLAASCTKTMGSKDSIDAQYTVAEPTLSISAGSVSFNSIEIKFNLDDASKAFQTGFEIAEDENLTESSVVVSKVAGDNTSVGGLKAETNYYIKGFVYGKGGQVVYSNVLSVKTAEAPNLPLAGKYTAIDSQYSSGSWIPGDPYEVEIKVEGTSVTISNLWDGGTDINATFDSSTNMLSIASEQIIMVHPTYGNAAIYFYNSTLSAFAETGYGEFTPKGGTLLINPYAVRVSAGSFGNFYTELVHDPVEE